MEYSCRQVESDIIQRPRSSLVLEEGTLTMKKSCPKRGSHKSDDAAHRGRRWTTLTVSQSLSRNPSPDNPRPGSGTPGPALVPVPGTRRHRRDPILIGQPTDLCLWCDAVTRHRLVLQKYPRKCSS